MLEKAQPESSVLLFDKDADKTKLSGFSDEIPRKILFDLTLLTDPRQLSFSKFPCRQTDLFLAIRHFKIHDLSPLRYISL